MPQVHFGMDPEFSMKDGSNLVKKLALMMLTTLTTYRAIWLVWLKNTTCRQKF
jgi:hypothetical protein